MIRLSDAVLTYAWCAVCQDWFDASLPHTHYKEIYEHNTANVVIDYRDKLDRIIKLLESIEYQLRTK